MLVSFDVPMSEYEVELGEPPSPKIGRVPRLSGSVPACHIRRNQRVLKSTTQLCKL